MTPQKAAGKKSEKYKRKNSRLCWGCGERWNWRETETQKKKKTIFVCAWNHPPRQDLYLPCCPSSTSLRSPLYRKAPICKWPRECLQQAAHDVSQNGAAKNNETQQIYGTTTGRRMARWSETRRKEKAKTWSGCNTSRLASFKIQSIFFSHFCGFVRLCAALCRSIVSTHFQMTELIGCDSN